MDIIKKHVQKTQKNEHDKAREVIANSPFCQRMYDLWGVDYAESLSNDKVVKNKNGKICKKKTKLTKLKKI